MIGDHPFGMMGWPSFRNDGVLFGMTVPASSFRKQGDLPLIISKITVIFPIINKRGKVGYKEKRKSSQNHSEILSFRRVKSSSKT